MADRPPHERLVHKLMTGDEWRAMRAEGLHRGGEHDRRDGYVHLSATAQVRESAAKHRAGERDLVLVCLDAAALGPALRWEAASGGTRPGLFPHLYGDLPLHAVRGVFPLPLDAARDGGGRHRFPGWVP